MQFVRHHIIIADETLGRELILIGKTETTFLLHYIIARSKYLRILLQPFLCYRHEVKVFILSTNRASCLHKDDRTKLIILLGDICQLVPLRWVIKRYRSIDVIRSEERRV